MICLAAGTHSFIRTAPPLELPPLLRALQLFLRLQLLHRQPSLQQRCPEVKKDTISPLLCSEGHVQSLCRPCTGHVQAMHALSGSLRGWGMEGGHFGLGCGLSIVPMITRVVRKLTLGGGLVPACLLSTRKT